MKITTGRGPKKKGREFENEIRATILETFPSLSPNDILARSMGDPGIDIILSEQARQILPFAIETKRTERLELTKALEQAEANAAKEKLKLCLVFRRNRSSPYAILKWEDLLGLLKERQVGQRECYL